MAAAPKPLRNLFPAGNLLPINTNPATLNSVGRLNIIGAIDSDDIVPLYDDTHFVELPKQYSLMKTLDNQSYVNNAINLQSYMSYNCHSVGQLNGNPSSHSPFEINKCYSALNKDNLLSDQQKYRTCANLRALIQTGQVDNTSAAYTNHQQAIAATNVNAQTCTNLFSNPNAEAILKLKRIFPNANFYLQPQNAPGAGNGVVNAFRPISGILQSVIEDLRQRPAIRLPISKQQLDDLIDICYTERTCNELLENLFPNAAAPAAAPAAAVGAAGGAAPSCRVNIHYSAQLRQKYQLVSSLPTRADASERDYHLLESFMADKDTHPYERMCMDKISNYILFGPIKRFTVGILDACYLNNTIKFLYNTIDQVARSAKLNEFKNWINAYHFDYRPWQEIISDVDLAATRENPLNIRDLYVKSITTDTFFRCEYSPGGFKDFIKALENVVLTFDFHSTSILNKVLDNIDILLDPTKFTRQDIKEYLTGFHNLIERHPYNISKFDEAKDIIIFNLPPNKATYQQYLGKPINFDAVLQSMLDRYRGKKRKSQKHKSRKHKSRKHKSRKHKRKHI
jgi:hypothetical protein